MSFPVQSKERQASTVSPTPSNNALTTPAELFLVYRRRSGWSQNELGIHLGGVSGRAVRNWESGCNLPKPAILLRLVEIYLENDVFREGQEAEEAGQLWRRVKTAFDNSTERLEAYPAFNKVAFRERCEARKSPAPVFVFAPARVPGNLPPLPSHLLERRQETESVLAALAQTRLLTLTGPGGVGKTTLELLVGAAIQDQFPDGVYFVELAPLTTSEAPLAATARVLGLMEEADRPLVQTVCDALRQKRTLLILDNIEHLLEGCAALVWDILRACPTVKILASGREAMRLREEIEWRVPSLRVPHATEEIREAKLTDLLEFESVELFFQRARNVGAYFGITPQSATTVARICRQLDGIPLAIELAAARVGAIGLESIAERLEKDFQLLSAGYRDAPRHHQTMRASIQWSYDLTTPAEQRLWQVLSLFSGGWTLPAAEAVCRDCGAVADTLAGLVDKSIVVVGEAAGAVRYRFLETLRQFGVEQRCAVARDDEARLRDNHLSYFAAFTAKIAAELVGPNAAFAALQIEAEYPNLRAALEWSARIGSEAARMRNGITLALSLQEFWFTRNYVSEARSQVASLIEAARCAGLSGTHEFARLLALSGRLAQSQNDFTISHSCLTEAIQQFEENENWGDLGIALRTQLHAFLEQGDYARGEAAFERACVASKKVNDAANLTFVLHLGCVIACFREDFGAALARQQENLRFGQTLQGRLLVSHAAFGKGLIALFQEQYDEAECCMQQATDLLAGINHPRAVAHHCHFSGIAAAEKGKREEALRRYQEGLRLWRGVGVMVGLAISFVGIADWLARFAASQNGAAYKEATLLCGLGSALFHRMDCRLNPLHQRLFDRTIENARAGLGEAAFAESFSEGQTMPLERAVTLSLSVGQ